MRHGIVFRCSAVYSPRPIGENPTDIQSRYDEWEATWTHTEGAITVKVVGGSNGVLKAGWVQNDHADLKYETADVNRLDGGGGTFASIKPQDEANKKRFVRARIEKKER